MINYQRRASLAQKILEKKYPAQVYDISAKNSTFRLCAERMIRIYIKYDMMF